MEQLYTRPDKHGQSVPYTEALHPRDSKGRWRNAYNKVTQPTIRDPRSIPRRTPINRGQGKAMTRRQNWAPIPWGNRRVFGKVLGLFDGSWASWRRSELRKRAKRQNKERYR